MIVAISVEKYIGKQGKIGVNRMTECDESQPLVYAHSMEEAIAWAQSYPTYAGLEVYDLGDGRKRIETEWTERQQTSFDILFAQNEDATHEKHAVTIYPVNTVFVNVGFGRTAAAAALGSLTSEAKAAASRENGKKGGRPRKAE